MIVVPLPVLAAVEVLALPVRLVLARTLEQPRMHPLLQQPNTAPRQDGRSTNHSICGATIRRALLRPHQTRRRREHSRQRLTRLLGQCNLLILPTMYPLR